jgi:ankyrin repeat protein
LNGASVYTETERGKTVLHLAAERGHEGVVQLLLDNGADVDAVDELGKIALHLVVECGHKAMAQLLKTDADTKDRAPQLPYGSISSTII